MQSPPECSGKSRTVSDACYYAHGRQVGVEKGYMSKAQFEAIRKANLDWETNTYAEAAKQFYQAQSYQHIGEAKDRVMIKIYDTGLETRWKHHLHKAMTSVNTAAPGINLLFCDQEANANITVFQNDGEGCYTSKIGVWYGNKPNISFDSNWKGSYERTAVHELLHALGYGHEHQRCDSAKHVNVDTSLINNSQYCRYDALQALTRFDPFSVLLYSESESTLQRNAADPVWKLQTGSSCFNTEMSELDKVALNLLYRPCLGETYRPRKSPTTHLFYCGREVMKDNNRPALTDTDGRCGPNNGPNCPACRVIESDETNSFLQDGKWQGWSGWVYCGREYHKGGFGNRFEFSDGTCGPNNGPPCNDCGCLLFPQYNYRNYLSRKYNLCNIQ